MKKILIITIILFAFGLGLVNAAPYISFTSTILPLNGDNANDIGTSTNRFRNLYISGSLIGGTITPSGLGTNMLIGTNGSGSLVSTSSPTVGYLTATSTTATSTFAGGLSVAGTSGLTVLQNGNVGIGTNSPVSTLNVVGDTLLKGNTISNIGGNRQWLGDFDAGIGLQYTTATGTVIAFIGDSWVEAQTYPQVTTDYLQNIFGFAGAGYISASTNAQTPVALTRATNGTWTNGTVTYGPTLDYVTSTDIATPATKTFTGVGTTLKIQYVNIDGGGAFTYAVDGGATTTVDTNNAITSIQTVSLTGLSSGSHSLVLTVTVAGTAGVNICGVDFQVPSTDGVRAHFLGYSGSTVESWLTQDETIFEDAIADLAPNLVIISLGVNDMVGNVVPATYATQLTALVNRIKTAMPNVSIILNTQGPIDDVGTYPFSDYVQKMKEVALDNDLGFVDNFALFESYAKANARGLMANQYHFTGAGYSLMAGNLNSFILKSLPIDGTSLAKKTRGLNTIAIGPAALGNITTGYANTVTGWYSGAYLDTGINASLYGLESGRNLTSSQHSSAFGYRALYTATTANNNAAFGSRSLYAATGHGNSGFGSISGYGITSGTYNSNLGYGAGYGITTGSYNISMGRDSMKTGNITGSYNIVLGSFVDLPSVSTSGQLNIGNVLYGTGLYSTAAQSSLPTSDGKIGIGTSSPYAKLSIHANNGETNTALFTIASSTASATTTHFTVLNNGNVGIGTAAPTRLLDVNGTMIAQSEIAVQSASPYFRLWDSTTGDDDWYFNADADKLNIIAKVGDATNTNRLVINGSGNVGIGTTSPYAKLSVVGETVAEYFTATSTTIASTFPYASSTAFTVSGSTYLSGLSAGGLGVGAGGLLYNYSTSTWTFASSTLLSDSNTFSGNNTFSNIITGSITGNAGTVTNGVYTTDTGTVTNTMLANSSLTVNGTSISLGGSGTITAASSTLLANNNTWTGTNNFSTLTASLFNLGSGLSNMLASFDSSGNLTSTSSPQVAYINATSTTATSTFAGGLSVAGTSGLTVLQNGKVGIGTVSPSYMLEVAGGSEVTSAVVSGTGSTATFNIAQVSGTSGRSASLVISGATSGSSKVQFEEGGLGGSSRWQIVADYADLDKLKFGAPTAAAGTKMTIDTSGKVGIGTTSPSQALSVNGNVLADSYLEYSPLYVGDALTAIKNIKAEANSTNGNWAKVDHSTLPNGVRYEKDIENLIQIGTTSKEVITTVFDGEKDVSTTTIEIVPVYATTTTHFVGRDLGAGVQLVTRAVQQIYENLVLILNRLTGAEQRITALENQNHLLEDRIAILENKLK